MTDDQRLYAIRIAENVWQRYKRFFGGRQCIREELEAETILAGLRALAQVDKTISSGRSYFFQCCYGRAMNWCRDEARRQVGTIPPHTAGPADAAILNLTMARYLPERGMAVLVAMIAGKRVRAADRKLILEVLRRDGA